MTEDENKIIYLCQNIERLFGLIGSKAACRGCGREICWIKHSNGKKAPYTFEALNHFIDCPNAKDFKTKPKPKNNHVEAA